MNEGDSWDNISADLLQDCAQLTKANSIDGVLLPFSYSDFSSLFKLYFGR
jgi:hypothetical protein